MKLPVFEKSAYRLPVVVPTKSTSINFKDSIGGFGNFNVLGIESAIPKLNPTLLLSFANCIMISCTSAIFMVVEEPCLTSSDIPGNVLAMIGVNKKLPSLSFVWGTTKIGERYVIFEEMLLTGAG